MMNLAIFYTDRRDFEEAESLLSEVLSMMSRIGDKEPSTALLVQFFLGELYRRQPKVVQVFGV